MAIMIHSLRKFTTRIAYRGNDLNILKQDFITSSGEIGSWEFVGRSDEQVRIFMVAMSREDRSLVAVSKQYPHLSKPVLELPSFLAHKSSPSRCPMEALEESTNIKADRVTSEKPLIWTDAWKSVETARIVNLRVSTHTGIPNKDVFLLSLTDTLHDLRETANKNELLINSTLYFLAQGMHFTLRSIRRGEPKISF